MKDNVTKSLYSKLAWASCGNVPRTWDASRDSCTVHTFNTCGWWLCVQHPYLYRRGTCIWWWYLCLYIFCMILTCFLCYCGVPSVTLKVSGVGCLLLLSSLWFMSQVLSLSLSSLSLSILLPSLSFCRLLLPSLLLSLSVWSPLRSWSHLPKSHVHIHFYVARGILQAILPWWCVRIFVYTFEMLWELDQVICICMCFHPSDVWKCVYVEVWLEDCGSRARMPSLPSTPPPPPPPHPASPSPMLGVRLHPNAYSVSSAPECLLSVLIFRQTSYNLAEFSWLFFFFFFLYRNWACVAKIGSNFIDNWSSSPVKFLFEFGYLCPQDVKLGTYAPRMQMSLGTYALRRQCMHNSPFREFGCIGTGDVWLWTFLWKRLGGLVVWGVSWEGQEWGSIPALLNHLIGLVVKASTSRAEDLVFESHLRQDFFRVESNQWLKNWHSSGYPARCLAW